MRVQAWLIRACFQQENMTDNGVVHKLSFIVRLRNGVLCHKTVAFICKDLRQCCIDNLLRRPIKDNLTSQAGR